MHAPNRSKSLITAAGRAALVTEFVRLRESNLSLNAAARALGRSPSLFSGKDSILLRYERGGVAALAPKPRYPAGSELSKSIEGLGWFLPAANFFYLTSSRRHGALNRAIRRALALPSLPIGWSTSTRQQFMARLALDEVPAAPAWLKDAVAQRKAAGQALVPHNIARRIMESPAALIRHELELPVAELTAPEFGHVLRQISAAKPAGVCKLTFELV